MKTAAALVEATGPQRSPVAKLQSTGPRGLQAEKATSFSTPTPSGPGFLPGSMMGFPLVARCPSG